ncbi:MAG: asparagine synthase-related protein, partial [Melioribacteraceae bacterium]
SAFGTIAHVPFLDDEVVELATKIPVDQKLFKKTEKWILRLALVDNLPTEVLMRTKSKFWEGSGIGEHFYKYAEGLISDLDFKEERKIKCGWVLNSKEELMYYRIFKEHFGELENLDWMGRTKNVIPDNA